MNNAGLVLPHEFSKEVLSNIDLSGRNIVVTGGYSGIGLEVVKMLASVGAKVVVPARDPAVAEERLRNVPNIQIERVDLSNPISVNALAEHILSLTAKIDILICSAGVMATPLSRDMFGNELQLSVNHLGHARLISHLWPALALAGDARIVLLSSRGHRLGGFDFHDPNFTSKPYDKWMAYAQAKTANALYALALGKRGRADGITAVSAHPGTVLTDLVRHLASADLADFDVSRGDDGKLVAGKQMTENPDFRTILEAAAFIVWCAVEPSLKNYSGSYLEDFGVAPVATLPNPFTPGVADYASDVEEAERLWSLTEQLLSRA